MSHFLRRVTQLIGLLSSCALVGCSYQMGHGGILDQYETISVPYAEGDQYGELTSEVIRQISSTGVLRYSRDEGDLILKLKMLDLSDENIGFRYDRKKDEKLKKALIPVETRLTAHVEVSVVEASTGNVILGPVQITGWIDFDHDYYDTSRQSNNRFSLGQLNDVDAAHDAVMHPLNEELAQRVVDYILNSW